MDPATIAILLGSLAASSAASVYTNQQNIKYAQQANEESIELANTAHQREVRDLQAAGLNPILSARGSGADVPQLKTPGLENPLEQLGSSAGSLASAFNGLTKAEVATAQAEASSAYSSAMVDKASVDAGLMDANSSAIENMARNQALTGIHPLELDDPDSLYFVTGDGRKAYDDLVQQYRNEIEQGRYLGSREHAIYNDIITGLGAGSNVINSASSMKRAFNPVKPRR